MTSSVKITVAGAGFAALTGLKELRKQLPDAELTLVAPKAEFIYLPSLIWVPYGMRNGDDLRFDIQALLNKLKVKFVQGSVTGISDDGRVLITDSGEVENDALLIATGGRFIKKLPLPGAVLSKSCLELRMQLRYVKGLPQLRQWARRLMPCLKVP